MPNRTIKFRAYLPTIRTMLYGIALYKDGMIGINPDEFVLQLNPDFEFDGERIELKDVGDGPYTFKHALTALTGDYWLYFPTEDYILMEYTGRSDRNGVEVWEGDCLGGFGNIVEYVGGGFCINGDRTLDMMLQHEAVKGNIHQLITQTNNPS